jgi:hypothetical protein
MSEITLEKRSIPDQLRFFSNRLRRLEAELGGLSDNQISDDGYLTVLATMIQLNVIADELEGK